VGNKQAQTAWEKEITIKNPGEDPGFFYCSFMGFYVYTNNHDKLSHQRYNLLFLNEGLCHDYLAETIFLHPGQFSMCP